jgi:thioredoxin 2
MSAIDVDDRGVIVACTRCGQGNRLAYERLGVAAPRCARCATPLPPPSVPIELENEELFEALVSRSALPVLVDFWAEWCGPCKMVAPEIQKAAALGAGRWIVAKVNTEALPAAAMRHSIRAIPLLALFRGGSEIARHAGVMPAAGIAHFIERHLGTGER